MAPALVPFGLRELNQIQIIFNRPFFPRKSFLEVVEISLSDLLGVVIRVDLMILFDVATYFYPSQILLLH